MDKCGYNEELVFGCGLEQDDGGGGCRLHACWAMYMGVGARTRERKKIKMNVNSSSALAVRLEILQQAPLPQGMIWTTVWTHCGQSTCYLWTVGAWVHFIPVKPLPNKRSQQQRAVTVLSRNVH
jgi:hypothetical protein